MAATSMVIYHKSDGGRIAFSKSLSLLPLLLHGDNLRFSISFSERPDKTHMYWVEKTYRFSRAIYCI
jgi:hypothetical protein